MDLVAIFVAQLQLRAVTSRGQQYARFLEAFANSSNPICKSTLLDTKLFAGLHVIEAMTVLGDVDCTVDAVDTTTGEHIHSSSEGRLRGSTQHEHLDAVFAIWRIAHQHHRGRRSNRNEVRFDRRR